MKLTTVAPFGFKGFPEDRVLPFLRGSGVEDVHVVRDYEVKYAPDKVLQLLHAYDLQAESYHSDHGPHIDLSHPDPDARRRALDRLADEARFARDIHVTRLVIHSCGTEGGDPSHRRDHFRDAVNRLAVLADQLDVTFFIENMPPSFSYGVAVAELVGDIQSARSDRLGLCFDTGHAHMGPLSVARQIADSQGFIHYIHAHDNNGREDQHLLPFTGTIDWDAVHQALIGVKCDPVFCLEVFEPLDVLQRKVTAQWWERLHAFLGDQRAG